MVKFIGIDIGSQKIMMVRDDGEIVLTDTGSVSRPNLISFFGRTRLIGEEALPQINGDNTVSMINRLLGESIKEYSSTEVSKHLKCKAIEHSSGLVALEVMYDGSIRQFDTTTLFSMMLSKLFDRIREVEGDDIKLAFSTSPTAPHSVIRAIKESCKIVGADLNDVSIFDSSDCLVKTYGRKLQALRDNERGSIQV